MTAETHKPLASECHTYNEREASVYTEGLCPICQMATIKRLRLALEKARRDLGFVCPKRGSMSPKRLIIQNAINRIDGALQPPTQT